MIKEIKHPRYRYQVKGLGYRYLFFNREDAYKCDVHINQILASMEKYIFENYAQILITIKKKCRESRSGRIAQHLNQIENCIHQLIFFTFRDDKERMIRNAYLGVIELQEELSIKKNKDLEVIVYTPLDLSYKSKWLVTER